MKILVPRDVGAVFDDISILNHKINITDGEKRDNIMKEHTILVSAVQDQIGVYLTKDILSSETYLELLEINKQIFEMVDLSKENKVTPKELDEKNYLRFQTKNKLQELFFGSGVKEVKLGYE